MTFQEFASKKVAGIPVLYLIGGAVAILAILAWKMPTSGGEGETPVEGSPDSGGDAALDENGYADGSNPYAGMATNGTVIVQQTQPTAEADTVKTNSDWVKEGSEWLVAQNKASGTVALTALTKYINGADRTYDENELVNLVIKEKGVPPDGVSEGGTISSKPLTRQFTALPGVHTVVGKENYTQLAALYYGSSSAEYRDLLQAANTNFGIAEGPFQPGTKINVPTYHPPKWWVVPSAMTKAQAAAKNGISVAVLRAYNNNPKYDAMTTIPKGYRLKVA